MIIKEFEDLPDEFKNEGVYIYYQILKNKKISIVLKRIFDIIIATIVLIILGPVLLIIGIVICLDSDGSPIFKQERITKYRKKFKIYKFRTMYLGSENGSQVTVENDARITKIGKMLRKYRLDELPQLINILKGDMSFVGARPEVKKYVDCYSDEMYATLLLPAGLTSLASIKYKDEDRLLSLSDDVDNTYVNDILINKMKYNLEYILRFSIWYDICLMANTVFTVFRKESIPLEKSVESSTVFKKRL